MVVSDLGFDVVETLEAYAPKIVSVEFTRELEEEMNLIEEGRLRGRQVLEDSIGRLKPILEGMKSREKEIGASLSEAVRKARLAKRTVGPCPVCKTGDLIIIVSRKTGKRFVGCTNWRRGLCDASFPLPQKPYSVAPVRRACPACGWPMVVVRSRGKRPWNLCLNPDCPRKKAARGSSASRD